MTFLSKEFEKNVDYATYTMSDESKYQNDKNSMDAQHLSKYYCNQESIREKNRSSYLSQIEMDEIMTYAYSSDENDYNTNRTNTKDSDEDSLGRLYKTTVINFK